MKGFPYDNAISARIRRISTNKVYVNAFQYIRNTARCNLFISIILIPLQKVKNIHNDFILSVADASASASFMEG